MDIFELSPTLSELIRHVDVGDNWYTLGAALEVDSKKLNGIEKLPDKDDAHKAKKMFELWLSTGPTATRRQVLEALTMRKVNETDVATRYKEHLLTLHDSTSTALSNVACDIFQSNRHTLKQVITCPVQLSQMLYSRRCIEEATLDQMETLHLQAAAGSLDEKTTTLLTAVHEAVFLDYRKLKEFATVLSAMKETKSIADQMLAEYAQRISDKTDVHHVAVEEVNHEDYVSDMHVLRNHYSELSQAVEEPVNIAKLLCPELIPEEVLQSVISARASLSRATTCLLKAIRNAVHSKSALESIITALIKFEGTASIGHAIFEDYKKTFPEGSTVSELKCYLGEGGTTSSLGHGKFFHVGGEIHIPQNMSREFYKIRCKFGATFYKIRRAIEEKGIDPEEMKKLLADCFPFHQPNIALTSIHEILEIVKEKCTLIDVYYLEVVAEVFDVEEAMKHITHYKNEVDKFCKEVSGQLCLDQVLQVVRSPQPLQCETLVFVLNWIPVDCTLSDIRDIISKSSGRDNVVVQIRHIGDSHSIAVTCFVPMSLIGQVIANVLHNQKHLKEKGLKKLIANNFIVWESTSEEELIEEHSPNESLNSSDQCIEKDEKKKDSRVELAIESINELKKILELQDRKIKKRNQEIDDLKANAKRKLSNDPQNSQEESERSEDTRKTKYPEMMTENRELTVSAAEHDMRVLDPLLQDKDENPSKGMTEISIVQGPAQEKQGISLSLAAESLSTDNILQESSVLPGSKSSSTDDNTSQPLTTVGLGNIAGKVEWYDIGVQLRSPSLQQCQKVTGQLTDTHLEIHLFHSISDAVMVLLPCLQREKGVRKLGIYHTSLTDQCMLSLSRVLTSNTTLQDLTLFQSSVSDEKLKDLFQSLKQNSAMTHLYIRYDRLNISTATANSLAELINKNTTLTHLYLYGTFNIDSIILLLNSMSRSKTLQILGLHNQHKKFCCNYSGYEQIKQKLYFSL